MNIHFDTLEENPVIIIIIFLKHTYEKPLHQIIAVILKIITHDTAELGSVGFKVEI